MLDARIGFLQRDGRGGIGNAERRADAERHALHHPTTFSCRRVLVSSLVDRVCRRSSVPAHPGRFFQSFEDISPRCRHERGVSAAAEPGRRRFHAARIFVKPPLPISPPAAIAFCCGPAPFLGAKRRIAVGEIIRVGDVGRAEEALKVSARAQHEFVPASEDLTRMVTALPGHQGIVFAADEIGVHFDLPEINLSRKHFQFVRTPKHILDVHVEKIAVQRRG